MFERAALALSVAERALLTDRLLQTLDLEDAERMERWGREADLRLDAFERGSMGATDGPDAVATIKNRRPIVCWRLPRRSWLRQRVCTTNFGTSSNRLCSESSVFQRLGRRPADDTVMPFPNRSLLQERGGDSRGRRD